MIKEITGDLFAITDQLDVIVHGCNCFSTMGAGVAKIVREKYPLAFSVDKFSPLTPNQKFGKITHTGNTTTPTIVNAYTQFNFRGPNNADYGAIRSAMKEVKKEFTGKRIGMPLIGAGLAGGDWTIIKQIIEEELGDEDVTIVALPVTAPSPTATASPITTAAPIQHNATGSISLDDLIDDYLKSK